VRQKIRRWPAASAHAIPRFTYNPAFADRKDARMALKSTIFKADLQIADMERGYYGSHALSIARYPSETDERM